MNPPRPTGKDQKNAPPFQPGISPGLTKPSAASTTPSDKPRPDAPSTIQPQSGNRAVKYSDVRTPSKQGSDKSSRSSSRWGTPADPITEATGGEIPRSRIPPDRTHANTQPGRRPNAPPPVPLPYPQSGNPSTFQNHPYSPQGKPQTQVFSGRVLSSTPTGTPRPAAYTPPGKPRTGPTTGQPFKSTPPQKLNPYTLSQNPRTKSTAGIPRRNTRRSSSKRKIYEDPNARPWKLFKWTMSTHKLKKITILLIIAGVMLIALAIGATLGITLLHTRN